MISFTFWLSRQEGSHKQATEISFEPVQDMFTMELPAGSFGVKKKRQRFVCAIGLAEGLKGDSATENCFKDGKQLIDMVYLKRER